MDESESKICSNCKREIPAVNYTIHTVHCARNIKVCPVCKEPVPQAELHEHHEKLHKLLPCKQCGESVCGTDLEDHIRDSCANTIKSCRFCELELPRRELPFHEGYCGVRTEQCPDCREWVMIKYRQLHLDSNHGFLRLNDDPAPVPKKDPPKNQMKPLTAKITNLPSTSNVNRNTDNGINLNRPSTEIRYVNQTTNATNTDAASTSSVVTNGEASNSWRAQANGVKPTLKRTNDQPQINTNVTAVNKVNKDIAMSRGAVKKRPAPKPPIREPPVVDAKREMAYHSALTRQQREERQRREQNAINLAAGKVLTPAAKLEKLRKIDALQNREINTQDYKNCLQGRVWYTPQYEPPGHVLGTSKIASNSPRNLYNSPSTQNGSDNVANLNGHIKVNDANQKKINLNSDNRNPLKNLNLQNSQNANNTQNENRSLNGNGSQNSNLPQSSNSSQIGDNSRSANSSKNLSTQNGARSQSSNGSQIESVDTSPTLEEDIERRRQEFKNLKPMTTQEFMERFNDLQLGRDRRHETGDRFSEIKSSLRELRRGLNEVTAPYNSPNNISTRRSPNASPSPTNDEVSLPCEFCGAPVPAEDLVQHQTGCRPDLAQYRPASPARRSSIDSEQGLVNAASAVSHEDPLIPCEFCTESLPVYLITEHQSNKTIRKQYGNPNIFVNTTPRCYCSYLRCDAAGRATFFTLTE